jgi:hypothetical protein
MLDAGGAALVEDVGQDRPVEEVQHVLRRGLRRWLDAGA